MSLKTIISTTLYKHWSRDASVSVYCMHAQIQVSRMHVSHSFIYPLFSLFYPKPLFFFFQLCDIRMVAKYIDNGRSARNLCQSALRLLL